MEHDLELFIPRLEILEIEVCNILYNPGNIGKRIFLISNILEIMEISLFQLPHILEILDRTIHTQSYPGNSGSYDPYSVLEILDRTMAHENMCAFYVRLPGHICI